MSMIGQSISIGELARRADCKPETVRYYERIGLLRDATRTGGGQRRYGDDAVRRLTFIRHARDFGFSVESVRELLAMSDQPDMPCQEVDAIATHHLKKVESRLQRLSILREELNGWSHSVPVVKWKAAESLRSSVIISSVSLKTRMEGLTTWVSTNATPHAPWLAQRDIQKQHEHQSDGEAQRGLFLVPASMSFGNNLMTDHIQHRPRCKGQPPGQ